MVNASPHGLEGALIRRVSSASVTHISSCEEESVFQHSLRSVVEVHDAWLRIVRHLLQVEGYHAILTILAVTII